LARIAALLSKRETPTCPFATRPATDTRAHWVVPSLVVEVRYTEWTADGRLRHPIYLGLRDDVPARTVTQAAERAGDASVGRARTLAAKTLVPRARVARKTSKR